MTNRKTLKRTRHGGRHDAVQLYNALAHGQPLPTVLAPDFAGGPVHMDVPFTYSRYFAMDVTYQPRGMVAVGSPGVVAGAAIGHLVGTTIGYARAASLSRPQWRGHQAARVVVTATGTWCAVAGRWLCFDHHAVINYQLTGDSWVVLGHSEVAVDPVLLGFGPRAPQGSTRASRMAAFDRLARCRRARKRMLRVSLRSPVAFDPTAEEARKPKAQ